MSAHDPDALRVAIVDDEAPARAFMESVLGDVSYVRVVGACPDGPTAVDVIRRERPDVVLLDVQMPEMDGFEVIEAVGAGRMPEVVFVTAHDEYTLQAFAVHAFDYILKPFTPDRLLAALRDVHDRLAVVTDDALSERLLALVSELKAHDGHRSAG